MEQGFWFALLIGGVLVAGLSAAQQVAFSEDGEQFRIKPVGRDFLLGAFMSSMVYYLMPDTVISAVEQGQDAVRSLASKATAQVGGAGVGGSALDVDLHLGPPRF
jgi:hypothetical protein